MAISKQQPMRPALLETIDAVNSITPGGTISARVLEDGSVTTAKLATSAVTGAKVLDGEISEPKLSKGVQDMLTFLSTVPEIDFGTSNDVSVPANSIASVDVTFAHPKTEAPVVFVGVQHPTNYGELTWHVRNSTNQQCTIIIANHGNADATGVTVDWLAISGR